ncbi:amino acid adenylation domain-containing protein [Microbulbifer echini]|uniref:Amino acid adenylation domain-containing protein n=1 Tax=Microbulbifer echini TaxID=1529067 RepID=A0ABV4NTC5_9GAMM
MSLFNFLIQLKEQRIIISLDDGQLRVRGNKDEITSEIKFKLKETKEEIIAHYIRLGITSNNQLAPVTLQQQRLIIIDKMQPGLSLFNMIGAQEIQGELIKDAINWSFQKIYERHGSLHTNFFNEDDFFYQVVKRSDSFKINEVDLSGISDGTLDSKLDSIFKLECKIAFDLEADQMLRVKLIKISEKKHILIYSMHHIVSDGWSMGVMLNELNHYYNAYLSGDRVELPPLRIQYSDYAHWQKKQIESPEYLSQVSYWVEQLEGIPEIHNLPLDRSRPAIQSYHGGVYRSQISAELKSLFVQTCRENNATLFMGLHAVFAILIHLHGNQNDVVIGTPTAGREKDDLNPLIGYFLNTLILRSRINSTLSFIDILEQSRELVLDAFSHQQVPIEKLMSSLGVDNDMSYSALFQVMLILQSNDNGCFSAPNLESKYINPELPLSKLDITLSIIEVDDGLMLGWEYNKDIFDKSTIVSFSKRFSHLIQSFIDSPNMSLMDLNTISEDDLSCLEYWGSKEKKSKSLKSVIEQFHQCVYSEPNKLALMGADDFVLTYQELDNKANQFANFLTTNRVVAGDVVGICLPRSQELVIAILALWKIGATYLPIDSEYPLERIQAISSDANLSKVLTLNEYKGRFPDLSILSIDGMKTADIINSQQKNFSPGSRAEPESLAYICYTSGSSGKPKGVMTTQGNLSSYLDSARKSYSLGENERVLQFSSPSFDIFVEEFCLAYSGGNCLVLRDEEILSGGVYFWEYLQRKEISFVSLPTAYWHYLVREIGNDDIPSLPELKTIVLGGEAMSLPALNRWNQYFKGQVKIINTYGPTECTVVATSYEIPEDQEFPLGIPIGKPLPHISTYILDEGLKPVLPGCVGELCLSGPSISPGYYNQPLKTTEVFVKSPWLNKLLYRTGDLVRYQNDGNLIFLGRYDRQLKVHGFRVDLGEIEEAIAGLAGIRSCYSQIIDEANKDKRIGAYVVADETITLEQLKFRASQILPRYMLPSTYIFLKDLPLTKNGKIDTESLPDFGIEQVSLEPLIDDLEYSLAEIWSELLRVDLSRIGANSHFFDLGGQSLLAMKLISEIKRLFNVELQIKNIFERSELRSLAQLIKQIVSQEELSAELSALPNESLDELEF